MAKKAKGDRADPKSNKSLAIRLVLAKMPGAKATEIAEAVQNEYGHKVGVNLVYLIKSKTNLKSGARRSGRAVGMGAASADTWIHSIRLARQLLKSTGSVENAVAILKAVEG